MRRASCRPTLAGTFTDLINKPEVTLTRLRVPRGITTVFGTGQRYVTRDGVVAVPPDERPPLLRAGFVRV